MIRTRLILAPLLAAACLLSACTRQAPAAVPEAPTPAEPSLPVAEPTERPDGPFANTHAEKLGQGREIAETICATCHAIGPEGDSPHPDAIPFRNLSKNYPVEDLAEPLAEGIMVGHPDMPVFEFEADHIDSLLTYIESIQAPHDL
ncbi:cytochrome c [Hyphomonas sp.]|uniref:c-type cytochrome n=1 Tax=Hyphomonas sp. TaxID=87 RepID=UPI0032EF2C54|tara:strand:+ start:13831 stop:14268 length:438 start_codon:yes stop_codon:yes gene_type:complete